jgi:glycosyltransferase involved in cell wall biosynthesis
MGKIQKPNKELDISIVIPCFNEEKSLIHLFDKLVDVLNRIGNSYEIIFVDDGSQDNSQKILSELLNKNERVKVIKFKTNYGKARALDEGFKAAIGSIVFTMDADLQDDPDEIPNFIKKLEEGYDLVSGWKKRRKDPWEKRILSMIFNSTVSLVTGIKLNDFNSGFKAYRRNLIKQLNIYGDLHRYIPVFAYWKGFRITEIPVKHHSRKFGKSKYGWKRYFQGFFDLFTVIFLTRFIQTPLYFFGRFGLFILSLGLLCLLYLFIIQIIHGSILGHRPLSYFGVLTVLFGSQLIATGLIADMLINIESKSKKELIIKKFFSFSSKEKKLDVSIIIIGRKSIENIVSIYRKLADCLSDFANPFEIIFFCDSGVDDTQKLIKDSHAEIKIPIKILHLHKYLDKNIALHEGFEHAKGNTIITLESDLQLNSNDIKSILNELDRGAAMVMGKQNKSLSPKPLISQAFNRSVLYITRTKISDLICSIRAYRKNILDNLELYGQRQIFLPIIISKEGYNVSEISIDLTESHKSKSKIYFGNASNNFLDLIKVILITDFKSRPLHMFGLIGIFIGTFGFVINLYLTILKIKTGYMNEQYTLLLIGVALMVLGLQWFSTGLLGELINKILQTKVNKEQKNKYK